MRPHEKLSVWQRAVNLVLAIYKATQSFPKDERFGLKSQIRRAAVSIPANIAEGAARDSQKEFTHFLSNAQGSASELETEILLAQKLGYLDATHYTNLRTEIDSVGRLIFGLSRSIKQKRI
ncbi:MAG: four helix bundle protein [Pyrinomonadaceae bacterium]